MRSLTLLLAVMVSTGANASDIQCLANTLFSEARGEPEAGRVNVGHTVMVRRKKLHKPICWIVKHGYTQKAIPIALRHYYHTLAGRILHGRYTTPIGERDSFDSHKRKHRMRGVIKIHNHYFYEALK